MTGARTHALLIRRNTRAWVWCSYPLGHDALKDNGLLALNCYAFMKLMSLIFLISTDKSCLAETVFPIYPKWQAFIPLPIQQLKRLRENHAPCQQNCQLQVFPERYTNEVHQESNWRGVQYASWTHAGSKATQRKVVCEHSATSNG